MPSKKALADGKDVPRRVLSGYPDILRSVELGYKVKVEMESK